MLVNISEDTALEMLMNRLSYWTDEATIHELYSEMYDNYINGGVFENGEFDVMAIVDNDYVNYCVVISEGDDFYEDIKQLYDEQGLSDISGSHELNHGYSCIEAKVDNSFLLRC